MTNQDTVLPCARVWCLWRGCPAGWIAALCVLAMASLPRVAAAGELGASKKVEQNSLEILAAAFGLEHLKDYTANQNALGYGYKHRLGVEASYMDLGESRFAGQGPGEADDDSDVGGRVDLRLAMDVSAPVARGARVFSRMGVYFWDLDINYNRVSNDFNSSKGGNGQVVSVGAAYDARALRLSVEFEQVNRDSVIATRDINRVLFNVSSKF
jgi:hypothetical protein